MVSEKELSAKPWSVGNLLVTFIYFLSFLSKSSFLYEKIDD